MAYCDKCISQDTKTGCCTHDGDAECIEGSEFVLRPEYMFMALYMLIYKLGGSVEIAEKSFEGFEADWKLLPGFNTETNKVILETSHKPPQEKRSMILIPKNTIPNKILKRIRAGRN